MSTVSQTFFEYPDKVERVASQGDRAAYEVVIRTSKTAKVRLLDALIKQRGAITSSYDATGPLVLLVWLDPAKAEAFRDDVKPDDMRYRSPTRFDNGSLIPLYESPEHELAERQARREAEQAMAKLAGAE